MAISILEQPAGPPAGPALGQPWPGASSVSDRVSELVSEAAGCLAQASLESVADPARLAGLSEEALAGIVAELARVESRAAALRLGLSAEADRRRVAERTGETGTDAWVARRTGTTREQAAGGLRIARLLAQKYPATREAFAAGDLRVEQVQVILNAAEQAPAPPTPQRRPTPRPGPAPPHLRRRRLHPPLRLVRDPPPPTQLEHRRPHRPRQRATPVRPPPPTNPRPTLPTQSPTRRRMDTPPTNLTTTRHPESHAPDRLTAVTGEDSPSYESQRRDAQRSSRSRRPANHRACKSHEYTR
jgi:hypothetical protein